MNTLEEYLAVMSTLPLLQSDAIAVLCGQDAEARVEFAGAIMNQRGAGVVILTGAELPSEDVFGARAMMGAAFDQGLDPDRLIVEEEARNTQEQARRVIDICVEEEWQRILVCASPYHSFRAMATFIRELNRRGLQDDILVLPATASQVTWTGKPPNCDSTRLELLQSDLGKAKAYEDDVAKPKECTDYFLRWEVRKWEKLA